MNICLISTTYPPRRGGLETHISTLATGLTRAGHEVCVFTNRDSHDQNEAERIDGVEVVRTSWLLGDWRGPQKVPWEEALFGALKDLEELSKKHSFNIVHTHTQAALLLGAMSKDVVRAPLVASLHETEPEKEPCGSSRSKYIVQNAPVDLFLNGSRFFLEQARRFGAPDSKLRLVYYGLDFPPRGEEQYSGEDQFNAQRKISELLNIPSGRSIITLVGRFKPRKGQKDFLEAIVKMKARNSIYALLIGTCNSASPEYLRELQDFINRYEMVDQVHIIEDCHDDLLQLIWHGSTLVTQPSHIEGLGFSVIEAMAAGKVVVGANVPGLDETIIDGQTGFLINTREPHIYAEFLDYLITNPDTVSTMGLSSADHARSCFSSERMIRETIAVYREAQNIPSSSD